MWPCNTIIMDVKAIREKVKGMPHVKTVWVKGDTFYIHAVDGAVKVDLSAEPVATIEETKLPDERPVKKSKK